MEHHPLQSLINLIEFDRDIIKKERTLEEIKKQLKDLEERKKTLINNQENTAKNVQKAKKFVQEHEQIMKELDQKEKEKKELLESSINQKVYDSLKKEINFLKKSQYDHEKQLVKSWKELETAQKTFDEEQTLFNLKKKEFEQDLNNKQTEIDQLNTSLEILYKERLEKEKTVPQDWIFRYNMMRKQTDNPIVPVEYDSCGGCFAQLPPQILLSLKRKKLLQCSSCYRFIYLPEELTEEPLQEVIKEE